MESDQALRHGTDGLRGRRRYDAARRPVAPGRDEGNRLPSQGVLLTMIRRVSLYLLAALLGIVLALSVSACGGYGHKNKGGKTTTSSGY